VRCQETEEHKSLVCAIRTEFLVQRGCAHEFEALWLEIRGMLAAAPGFRDEVLLNCLGYPGKYVAISKWEDRKAFATFYRSPAFGKTARSGDGLYRISRPEEAYEVALTVGQPPTKLGGWRQLVEWDIKPGAAAAFEASRKTLFDLRQRHGGIFMSQLCRFLGNSSRYFVMQAYENRDAERAGLTIPEIQEFFAAHPATEYVSHWPTGEYYTATQVAGPAA
jgi:heme-degrading monooxygenase HmoA